jgi:hypothetical protein
MNRYNQGSPTNLVLKVLLLYKQIYYTRGAIDVNLLVLQRLTCGIETITLVFLHMLRRTLFRQKCFHLTVKITR